MKRTLWIVAGCGVLAGLNAVRQALFATAAVSPWLATLSGGVALVSATTFLLVRRRHPAAAPALVTFGVALLLATVLGTEPLLADAVPLAGRLPGYFTASALGLWAAWGGVRELTRERSLRAPARAAELPSAASSLGASPMPGRRPADTHVPKGTV